MTQVLDLVEIQNSAHVIVSIAYPRSFLERRPDGTIDVPMSAAEQIESYAQLEPGWDYGAGSVIQQPTIDAAHVWNRLLTLIGLETNAAPGADGEIAVAGSRGSYYLEVIVEPDQSTSVAYDVQGAQEFYRLNRPAIEVLGSVLDVAGEIWSASTWYTPKSTMPQNVI